MFKRNENEAINRDIRKAKQENQEQGSRNYRNPDPLNCGLEGKSVTITMTNGRMEAGILRTMGQFSISIEMTNNRILIVNKSAIITVSVL